MKIIFWKNPTSFFGKAICWWTNSNYYHSEILFSDNKIFSASIQNNKCEFFNFNYIENEIDIFDLNITLDEERIVRKFCEEENGSGYDLIGIIFSIIFTWQIESKTKWFCSELCIAALQTINIFTGIKANTKTPRDFYRLLMEARIVIPKKVSIFP